MTRWSVASRLFAIAGVAILSLCIVTYAQDYAGIDRCTTCHGGIVNAVLGSQHPDKVLSASEILTTDGTGESAAGCSAGISIFDPCTAGYATYVAPFDEFFNASNVEYCLGRHWKQRFMTRTVPADGDTSNNDPGNVTLLPAKKFVVMGIQWNIALQRWQNYHGPLVENNWYDNSREWNKKCGSCHTTAFNPIDDFWVEQNRSGAQHGVTCEGCHGPADSHRLNVFETGEKPPFPENFAGGVSGPPESAAEAERRLEICGQCHGRGASAPNGTYGFPFNDDTNQNYVPGNVLADYYTQTTSASSFWPDGTSKKHHQQYIDFQRSSHWTGPGFAGKLNCMDCHDPHNGGTVEVGSALCQDCHTDKVGAAFTAHTGGGGMTEAVMDCNGCHMPFMAKSINAYDIRAHTFRIVPPSNTLDPSYEGMPNSCTSSCHFTGADQGFPLSNEFAQNALYNIRFANGGSKTEVLGLTLDKAGTDLALFWSPSTDANHALYRVYRTTDPSSALIDAAHWTNVTSEDLDGDFGDTDHTRPPDVAVVEFFLVVDEGTYVGDGPWGHYSR